MQRAVVVTGGSNRKPEGIADPPPRRRTSRPNDAASQSLIQVAPAFALHESAVRPQPAAILDRLFANGSWSKTVTSPTTADRSHSDSMPPEQRTHDAEARDGNLHPCSGELISEHAAPMRWKSVDDLLAERDLGDELDLDDAFAKLGAEEWALLH